MLLRLPGRRREGHLRRAIGREIALHLAQEGADVALASRSVSAMQEVAALVRGLGRDVLVVPMDVADEDAVASGAARVLEAFGRVDVLVSNSGIGGPSRPLWQVEPHEWEETFRANVTGAYLVCRAFLPTMVEAGSGSIVLIGSMTGKRPLVNRTPYAASKTALTGLVRTLAAEAGPHGVRVSLASPAAAAITGEDLNVRAGAVTH